ncbi:MAG: extracellular solute-binding protein [Lachnospiraceae bacterium]|nr:extracellular solute-binding protein [Lachnospiraceae bacterium]
MVCLLLLAACTAETDGGQEAQTAETAVETVIQEVPEEQVIPQTVRFRFSLPQEDADLLTEMTAVFNRENTKGVTVEIVPPDEEESGTGEDEGGADAPDEADAGEGMQETEPPADADLLLIDAKELPLYTGRAVSLQSLIAETEDHYRQLNPALLKICSPNGSLRAIPLMTDAVVAFSHTALLEEAGITSFSEDWDAVLEDGRHLLEEKNMPLIGVSDAALLLETLLAQNECAYLADEGILFQNEAGKSALELYLTLFREGIVVSYEEEALIKAFQDKKVAAMLVHTKAAEKPEFAENAVQVSEIPMWHTRAVPADPKALVLLTKEEAVQYAAMEFVAYLTEPEQNAMLAIGTARLPARDDVYELPSYRTWSEDTPYIRAASMEADALFFAARNERQQEMHLRLTEALYAETDKETDADEVLAKLGKSVHGGEE